MMYKMLYKVSTRVMCYAHGYKEHEVTNKLRILFIDVVLQNKTNTKL